MTSVAEFAIAADASAWQAVGFDVDSTSATTGSLQIGGIRIRLTGTTPGEKGGLIGWALADAPDQSITDIDGLSTTHSDASRIAAAEHPNTVFGIDHVVVYTPDLERSCDAIGLATGAQLKRIREAGPIRQGFHRLGELIVEVVTFPTVEVTQSTFWGLALNVTDIDAIFDRYGDDVISRPKQAVQPGRQIASFRQAAGLGLPVAVMTVQ